jgi:hypothetical protein
MSSIELGYVYLEQGGQPVEGPSHCVENCLVFKTSIVVVAGDGPAC